MIRTEAARWRRPGLFSRVLKTAALRRDGVRLDETANLAEQLLPRRFVRQDQVIRAVERHEPGMRGAIRAEQDHGSSVEQLSCQCHNYHNNGLTRYPACEQGLAALSYEFSCHR